MSLTLPEDEARRGWDSDFDRFAATPVNAIVHRLRAFLADSSREQIRAWDESIPSLQHEVVSLRGVREESAKYTAILEYELPLESRRADAVFLLRQGVLVIELKGKSRVSDADVDQAHAYARDLRCYHAECEHRDVYPLLVPTGVAGDLGTRRGVRICGPDVLAEVIAQLDLGSGGTLIDAKRFLSSDAYRPLPTLVAAARELFVNGTLRHVKRAAAATDEAVACISDIVHTAARTRSRKLVLVSGVPGAGKTLVGLRLVHSHFIDDLAVPRAGGKPTSPAVFLSGNGPLVEVLQYELKDAGGGGKTFVRDVKNYVKTFAGKKDRIPSEHVLVYDEAQRAYDAAMVAAKHPDMAICALSEPELFIEFAERIPEWCVVVGLIGSGQEIHTGEEGGTIQWANAIARSARRQEWSVHAPAHLLEGFQALMPQPAPALNLNRSLRSHLSFRLHEFVASLVSAQASANDIQAMLAAELTTEGHDLRITRDFAVARQYLHDRYADNPDARFGLVASSRDRDLERFGVPNGFQDTKRLKYGQWYGDAESLPGRHSCRHLRACVTEFGAQGLELDAVLLAWGTDFCRQGGRWDIGAARGYRRGGPAVQDPWQLRANAYRVLLTRARDATVVFLPPIEGLNETYDFLLSSGFRNLETGSLHT